LDNGFAAIANEVKVWELVFLYDFLTFFDLDLFHNFRDIRLSFYTIRPHLYIIRFYILKVPHFRLQLGSWLRDDLLKINYLF
jgi:hypothetical protein